MTATTSAREALQKDGDLIAYKMAATTLIPKGTLVAVNSSGYAIPLTNTEGIRFVGVAHETINNTGSAGDKEVRVYTTGTFMFVDSGGSQADVGAIFYAVDNQTVTNTITSGAVMVGVCVESVAATQTRIRIDGFTLPQSGQVNHATATAKLDLSGAAAVDVPIVHVSQACTIHKIILLYTEASSSDAGVNITVGNETDADAYYTGTSEVSKDQWYEISVTPISRVVAAGSTIVCGCAGGKVGTGEVLVSIEYVIG